MGLRRSLRLAYTLLAMLVLATLVDSQISAPSDPKYPELELKLRVFIPSAAVNFMGDIVPSNLPYMYGGDNRDFCYDCGQSRFEKVVVVTADPNRSPKIRSDYSREVTTTRYLTTQGVHVHGPHWWWDLKPGAKPVGFWKQDVPEGIEVSGSEGEVLVKFAVHNIGNPYIPFKIAPDADLSVYLFQCGDNIYYQVIGQHDEFPAYEIYLNRKLIYQFMPSGNLSPGMMVGSALSILQKDVSIDWTLLGKQGSEKRIVYTFSRLIDVADNVPFPLLRGDVVQIKTRGRIGLGPFAGETGPEGLPNGAYSAYSYYPSVNHGAIMGRIGGANDSIVFKIGKGLDFTAPAYW